MRGIMTLRLTQLRFAAVALFAAAVAFTASSVAVPSARAFTMENLSTNGGNTTRFADPNDRVKNFDSQGSRPFGQNGPTVHFCFNHTATTEIYTLSLHDALPI